MVNGSRRERFWGGFDLHVKRWQAFFALLVAISLVGGWIWTQVTGGDEVSPEGHSNEVALGQPEERLYVGSSVSSGWGPARPTYSMKLPAAGTALNSIVDSPYGDERNFTRCKHLTADSSTYSDTVAVSAGAQIEVYVYLDSSTSPSRPEFYAENVVMQLFLPAEPSDDPGIQVLFSGIDPITRDEIKVWDGCRIVGDRPIKLSLLPESGRVITRTAGEQNLADSVISGNQPIPSAGDGSQTGQFPANGYYGYFTFTVLAIPI